MIEVKVYELEKLEKAVSYAKRSIVKPTEPLEEIASFYRDDIKNNFEQERSPDGTPWAQLAPATVKQKRTSYILRETLALFNSVRVVVQSLEVRVLVDAFYAVFHQEGTSKMAARPFVGVSDRHFDKIEKIVIDWVKKIFRF